jgi:methionyl-tRNA formyltransferase
MRVLFMGTPDFAVPTLEAIVAAGHEVVLVVAQPDKPVGRGRKLRSPPVAARAKELGLPLSQPRAIKSGRFPARVQSLEADVGVVIAYGRILTPTLLGAPRLGCINVHASLLPRWRGAAPIQAAILAGDTVTGVCTQQMELGLDTGPLYLSRELAIEPRETAGTLHDKLSQLSAACAVDTLALIEGTEPTPQLEDGITWASLIAKQDGRFSWDDDAHAIDRRVRAMTPWPGGHTGYGDGVLKVHEARPVEGSGAPGEVLSTKPFVVACGTGALELVRVQAPGRKPVSGVDFANGARIQTGGTL